MPMWCVEIRGHGSGPTILTPDEYLGAVQKLCQDGVGAGRLSYIKRPRDGEVQPAAQ
jgi:hypothetical protein